jgi:TRAP-type C4-dicarboxylate transport system permease small subunit
MQELEERVLLRCGKPILRVSRIMGVIAAAVLGVMMVITVADVCGRYFFLKPIEGTFEIVGIFLVIAASLSLGYCQLNLANIRITVLSDLFSQRTQSIIFLVAYIIAAVVSAMISWQGGLRAWEYMFKELGATTVTLGLPFWPFMLLLTIGFAWVCIIFLIDIYFTFREVFKHGTD